MPRAFDERFLQLVEPHRHAIRLHCYRMLGSSHDSDDMLQETLLRAWRAHGSIEEPSRVLSWLYRIATNVCLDELKDRKDRPLPSDVVPPGDPTAEPTPSPEATWLEPCPDTWLVGTSMDPGSTYELKESVAIAFMALLQSLSAQQRAVLLLRDVVGMSAEETANALEMAISAVNSTLHRARTAVRERIRGHEHDGIACFSSEINGALLRRYIGAWQALDIDAFEALLHEDVQLTMPPSPTWMRGKVAIATFYTTHAFAYARDRELVFLPTTANGQPAFGFYVDGKLTAIHVLRFYRGLVIDMHHFMAPECFGVFGLPKTLSAA